MSTGRRRRRTSAVLGVILASSVALSAAEADVQRTASDVSDVSIAIDAKRHVSEKPNLRTLAETETETISSDTPDLALDLGLDTNIEANTNEEVFVALAEDPLVDHPDLNIKACLEKDDGTTICSKNRAQAEWMKWPLESVQGLPIISNLCVENSNNWPIALNKARKQWNKKSRGAVQLKYRQAECDTRQNAQLTHIPNAIHVVYGTCGPDCCGKADVEYKVRAFVYCSHFSLTCDSVSSSHTMVLFDSRQTLPRILHSIESMQRVKGWSHSILPWSALTRLVTVPRARCTTSSILCVTN